MHAFLEITSGEQKGSRFRLEEGVQVGRTKGQIRIDDPKVSGLHAQIELNDKGQFVLVDLDSSNGLIINGRKVKRIILLTGATFEIGTTTLQVLELDELEAAKYGRVVTWRTIIKEQLSSHSGSNDQANSLVQVFNPLVTLKFFQGIQYDQEVQLAYGPRVFGSESLDVELLDPDSPTKAFEIIPTEKGPRFKNLAGASVQLNKKAVLAETLKAGDIISVGSTLIRVEFL